MKQRAARMARDKLIDRAPTRTLGCRDVAAARVETGRIAMRPYTKSGSGLNVGGKRGNDRVARFTYSSEYSSSPR